MFPNTIPIPMPGGLVADIPRFVKIRQKFNAQRVDNIEREVAKEFGKFSDRDLRGKSIAIGVGSRGIKLQPQVVKAVIHALKQAGAEPFIFPSMGSHGGGTSEGQADILRDYGFGEEMTGVPICASMDVVQVGQLDDGTPVYCDRIASEADHIVICNRIKPHTNFRGHHESGLIKMMAIGMAKLEGAVTIHRHGFDAFHEIVPAAGRVFLENTNVLFAIAMVENAYEELLDVELVPREEIFARDKTLLDIAKANIPQLLVPNIDLLFVDEIGKNISGSGMDPNVTGRTGDGNAEFQIAANIRRIVVSDLTDVSHGNATGVAMADVTTQKLVQKTNWSATYVNVVTAGSIEGGAMPLVADNDQMAVAVGLRGCAKLDPANAKIVRIRSTLELSEIWVSEPVLADIAGNENIEVVSELFDPTFDAVGNWPAWS